MTEQGMLNVGMELLCIMVCGILLIHQIMIKTHRPMDRWFRLAIVYNMGMMLGDLADWMLPGARWTGARLCYLVGMTLYFACSGGLLFSFYAYIYYYWEDQVRLSSIWVKIGKAMMAVQVLLAVVSPFTGAFFTISEACLYQRGPLFFQSQVTAVVTYFMTFCIYVYAYRRMNLKEKCCFFFYLIIPLTAEIIQVSNYGIVLLNLAITMSFLLVNLFINTEMEARLRSSEQKLIRERMEALRELQLRQEKLVDETIHALSNTVEAKDRYTNGHS